MILADAALEERVKRAARERAALIKASRAGKFKQVRTLVHAHIASTHADLARVVAR